MDIESQLKFVFMLGSIVAFTVIFSITLIVFPISYMMNKYIHHGIVIRWMMGMFGVLFAPFVIIYSLVMAFFQKQVYYYGLFPSYIPMTLTKNPQLGGGPAGTWLTRIYELILQLSSPVSIFTDLFTIENFTVEESNAFEAYRKHIKMIYEGSPKLPRFDVELMKQVKDAGKETTLDKWVGVIHGLQEKCEKIFGPKAVPLPESVPVPQEAPRPQEEPKPQEAPGPQEAPKPQEAPAPVHVPESPREKKHPLAAQADSSRGYPL